MVGVVEAVWMASFSRLLVAVTVKAELESETHL
jgi:hypothetical protein